MSILYFIFRFYISKFLVPAETETQPTLRFLAEVAVAKTETEPSVGLYRLF